MPAEQHPAVDRLTKSWRARWYDEHGQRQAKAGFNTKTEARDFCARGSMTTTALRRGDIGVLRRHDMATLGDLIDEYLAQHVAGANTIATLTARLERARTASVTPGSTVCRSLSCAPWRRARALGVAYVEALSTGVELRLAVRLLNSTPAKEIQKPQPKRQEVKASVAQRGRDRRR